MLAFTQGSQAFPPPASQATQSVEPLDPTVEAALHGIVDALTSDWTQTSVSQISAVGNDFRVLLQTHYCLPNKRMHLTGHNHLYVEFKTSQRSICFFCANCRLAEPIPNMQDAMSQLIDTLENVKRLKELETISHVEDENRKRIDDYETRLAGQFLSKQLIENVYKSKLPVDKQDEVANRMNVFCAAIPVPGGISYAFRWTTDQPWVVFTRVEKKLKEILSPYNLSVPGTSRMVSAFQMWNTNPQRRTERDASVLGIPIEPRNSGNSKKRSHDGAVITPLHPAPTAAVTRTGTPHWIETEMERIFPEGRAAQVGMHILVSVMTGKVPSIVLVLRGNHPASPFRRLLSHLAIGIAQFSQAKELDLTVDHLPYGHVAWCDIRDGWNWRDISFKKFTLPRPKAIVVQIPPDYNYRHMVMDNLLWFVVDEVPDDDFLTSSENVDSIEETRRFLVSTEAHMYSTPPRAPVLTSLTDRMKRHTHLFDGFVRDWVSQSTLETLVPGQTITVEFGDIWRDMETFRQNTDTPLWNPNMSMTSLVFKSTFLQTLQKRLEAPRVAMLSPDSTELVVSLPIVNGNFM